MTQVSGLSTLAFTHSGSGVNSKVQLPSTAVLEWSTDTGISRLGAASLAIGNGTAGDFTGALKMGPLTLIATADSFSGSYANNLQITDTTYPAIQLTQSGNSNHGFLLAVDNNGFNFSSTSGTTTSATTTNIFYCSAYGAGPYMRLASTVDLQWSTDTGISRLGAASLAIGNGTAGDVTGTLSLTTIDLPDGGSLFIYDATHSKYVRAVYETGGSLYIGSGGATANNLVLELTGGGNNIVLNATAFDFQTAALPLVWNSDTGISRLGLASLAIGNGTAGNTSGNLSYNRVNLAGADYAGTVTITAAATTQAVSYAANYTGTAAPVVVATPTSDPLALGVPVGYWVTPTGSAGAWTGFTMNIQTALAGNVTFNYIVVGKA
jgi:hypothetical protein